MSTTRANDGATVVVLNPVSGTGEHREEVLDRSRERGYEVRETEGESDAIDIARAAAEDGASLVAAAGGDGTLNEVVRGLDEADALEAVTVGVVPCGTGNDFAGNLGVTGIEQAFEVLEGGERRRIDLGMAGDRPFVNSCICGLTAEASARTTSDQKSRMGTVAYVLETLGTLSGHEGVSLSVDAFEADRETPLWSGRTALLLVGNGRQFPPGGQAQADMEDGLLDITFVEDGDTADLLSAAALEQFLGRDTERTVRRRAPALRIEVLDDEPTAFSLDGEIVHHRRLSVRTRPGALSFVVGDGYDPSPDA